MKAKAADLYSKMTDYNTIVFTFLWCDVTIILGIKHKQVQEQKLQISDVGRLIKLLCVELTEHYRIDSEMPEKFPLVDSYGNHIMHQFWGKNYYTGMFNITFDSNILIYI